MGRHPLLWALLLLAVAARASPVGPSKVLFLHESVFWSEKPPVNTTLSLHRPYPAGKAIQAAEPWEAYGILAYNTILRLGPAEYRLYYDCCAQGTPLPSPSPLIRQVCMATSQDGVSWVRPRLGVVTFANSTDNNIVFPIVQGQTIEPGAVFVDENPAVGAEERIKMLVSWTNPASGQSGTYVLASPDGIHFHPMFSRPSITGSDTMNVGWWDPVLKAYTFYVRLDVKTSGFTRKAARCVTTDLSNFESRAPREPIILGDEVDQQLGVGLGVGLDVYTPAAVPYGDWQLYFPSWYLHFSSGGVWKAGNDGILDIRFMAGFNGSLPAYPPVRNARRPFVELGLNRCLFNGSLRQPGGWCSPFNNDLALTSSDTSAMYMAAGWVLSPSGEEIWLFHSEQPFTHGGYHVSGAPNHPWGNNTGVSRVALRTDGFVSLDGEYTMCKPFSDGTGCPTAHVGPMTVPSHCTSDVTLRLNVATGVAGWCAVGLLTANGDAITGFSLAESDPVVGNFLNKTASWGGPTPAPSFADAAYRTSVRSLAGQSVVLQVSIPDASLYSLAFVCES